MKTSSIKTLEKYINDSSYYLVKRHMVETNDGDLKLIMMFSKNKDYPLDCHKFVIPMGKKVIT